MADFKFILNIILGDLISSLRARRTVVESSLPCLEREFQNLILALLSYARQQILRMKQVNADQISENLPDPQYLRDISEIKFQY
jgi:hypothetical protein